MYLHYKRNKSPKKSLYQKQPKNRQFTDLQAESPFKTFEDSQSNEIIKISQPNIIKNLEIYAWRSRTYLPILKPTHITVHSLQQRKLQNLHFQFDTSNINHTNCLQKYNQSFFAFKEFIQESPNPQNFEVQVKIQEIKCRLKQVNDLPLPQTLYLLKEILIGFELLIDIFGFFLVTDEMIVVNASNQWRVWINQNFIKNEKRQAFNSQKQFLKNVVQLVQKHCLSTSTTKQFFVLIKQIIQQKEPTFLQLLSKINQYISINKVFQVNRVLLPLTRLSKPCISQKNQLQFASIRNLSSNSKNSPLKRQKTSHFQPQIHKVYQNNQEKNSLNSNQIYNHFAQDFQAFSNQTPNPLKPTSYQHLTSNLHLKTIQSYKSQKLIYHPEVCSPKYVPNINHFNTPKKEREQNMQFTPKKKNFTNVFNMIQSDKLINPSLSAGSAEANRYRQAKSPSPVKFQQTPIRCISGYPQIQVTKGIGQAQSSSKPQRKYSDNLQKIKSTNALKMMQKKIAGSSIYQTDNMGKMELKKQLSSNDHQGYQIKIHNNKNSSQVSPNNSSSTKEVKNSGQRKTDLIPGYLKMKQKDLGPNKVKNSLSFVNSNGRDQKGKISNGIDKNMTISHQFLTSNKEALNNQKFNQQNQDSAKVESKNQWINSISGLFSDNISIKHLKESVKLKMQEEEQPFEKEYLKDVKLDKLQKFGRKVNHMVVQQDQSKYTMQNHYKSMQLIQEQTEQVKSYLQSERRQEQDFKSKQICLKNQQMQVKSNHQSKVKQQIYSEQYKSQYDDNDAESEIASSNHQKIIKSIQLQSLEDTGFNFQTQMYVINQKRDY